METSEAAGKLVDHGVLGIFCLLLLGAVIFLFKKSTRDAKVTERKFKEKEENCKTEIKALQLENKGLQDRILELVKNAADKEKTIVDTIAEKYEEALQDQASRLALEFSQKLQDLSNKYSENVNVIESRYLKVYAETLEKVYELSGAIKEFVDEAKQGGRYGRGKTSRE